MALDEVISPLSDTKSEFSDSDHEEPALPPPVPALVTSAVARYVSSDEDDGEAGALSESEDDAAPAVQSAPVDVPINWPIVARLRTQAAQQQRRAVLVPKVHIPGVSVPYTHTLQSQPAEAHSPSPLPTDRKSVV